jgi:ParB family chromosome partitioning protein
MSADKRNALGRGLGALLNDSVQVNAAIAKKAAANQTDQPETENFKGVNAVKISEIEVNPFQPRTEFDEQALQELADSISVQGLIQPVTVRKTGARSYQLISGERRLRASKLAGLTEIPAYVRTANDQQMLEMALIENIQRENLNAIEMALSFQRMIDECHLKQEELGDRVSKNRSTVTNYLRLLKLPPVVQSSIRDGQISMGHARALVNVEDAAKLLFIHHQIIEKGLSVRKVEELVRELQKNPAKKSTAVKPDSASFQVQKIQSDLTSKFNAQVKLKVGQNGKGSIEIPFISEDDLSRILEMLDW